MQIPAGTGAEYADTHPVSVYSQWDQPHFEGLAVEISWNQ